MIFTMNNGNDNPGVSVPPAGIKDGAMKKFKNYDEIKGFLSENSAGISGVGLSEANLMRTDMMKDLSMEEPTGWGASPSSENVPMNGIGGGSDYSATNIQVEGVDEGDIVKTDGKYVYTASEQKVLIVDAFPADSSSVLSEIKFDSSISGIYIKENKLAVYGQDYNIYKNENYEELLRKRGNDNYAFLKIFDISDKTNPREERSLNFEGNFINSRLIEDHIYFVTANYSSYYGNEIPVPLIMENEKILNAGDIACGNCWGVYYFNTPYRSPNFTGVSAVNISDSEEKIISETYLLDGNQNNMFVSQNNIYITYNKYISEEELVWDIIKEMILPGLNEKDREKIAEIENAKNYILSPQEKIAKIMLILANFAESLSEDERDKLEKELEEKVKRKYEDISKELEKTVIHKIAINKGALQYKNAGEVPGIVLNQFSMDENNNYFRVATTKNRRWSRSNFADTDESYNNLYVLDENMKIVGQVEKLAAGERIYSVRFMQDRAYLVTFKQTDPLFVIDLKNPTDPQVLGELKIPGFSSYLHPYDETTLIGLGKDSGDWNAKLKLSLFDVSDVSNPKEIDNYILGEKGGNSIALTDHKAFLFSEKKNLLAIPANWEESGLFINDIVEDITMEKMIMPNPNKYFNGAAVFFVDKSGFKLKGTIDHSDGNNNYNYGYGRNMVKRSLYIENILYTLSDMFLKMNNLNNENLEEVNSLRLSDTSAPFPPTPIPIPMPMIER